MSDYRYPAVGDLASTFLPRNREAQARIVDNMLATRDTQIDQLKNDVRNREAAIERYMHENAELRGYIGQQRSLVATAHEKLAAGLAIAIPTPPRPPRKESTK